VSILRTDGPNGALCACGQPATQRWSMSSMEFARGYYSWRCERCCLVDQLAHARERAKEIPIMEARLAELGATPNGGAANDR
jgi:hypothetical protein